MSDNRAREAAAEKKLKQGHWQEARNLWQKLQAEEPDNPVYLSKIGVTLAKEGKLDQAQDYFEQALARDERYAPALNNLGNIQFERGNLGQARRCYEKALELDPNDATAHNNMAVVSKKQGDVGKAVRHLKRSQRVSMRENQTGTDSSGSEASRGCLGPALLLTVAPLLVMALAVV